LEVWPSPKFQVQLLDPVDRLVKITVNIESQLAVAEAEKAGIAGVSTVICLLIESMQAPKVFVRLTVYTLGLE
jgi:hypothetical protein